MDLDVVMKSNECPYIVQFYGALFKEVLKSNFFDFFFKQANYFYFYCK